MARRKYKFTEKTHSVRAVAAILFAAVSMLIFFITVQKSVESGGNGSVYLGVAGLFSMVSAVAGLYFAIGAVREEDTFRILPSAGMLISLISCGVWVAVYVSGFLL